MNPLLEPNRDRDVLVEIVEALVVRICGNSLRCRVGMNFGNTRGKQSPRINRLLNSLRSVAENVRIYRDISVTVKVHYLRHESNPSDLRWVFAYTITIRNNGSTTMQLIDRHWEITSGVENDVEIVDGDGVVGKQPRLEPGDAFQYTSAAVLESSFGTMEGHYNFRDDVGEWYRVPIDPFILSIPAETMN